MGAQPILKRRERQFMAADFGFAMEKQRHTPAVGGLERRVRIDVDRRQPMLCAAKQRAHVSCHVLAERAALARVEREFLAAARIALRVQIARLSHP